MPQQQQQQQLQAGPSVEHMMVRAANPMQQATLPPGAAPQGLFVRNPMGQPQRLQWQVRHPQEVTLQQRGPLGVPGPTMVVGAQQRLPIGAGMIATPMQMTEAGSDPVPNRPPTPLNLRPASPPPESPQTEEDHQKVSRYIEQPTLYLLLETCCGWCFLTQSQWHCGIVVTKHILTSQVSEIVLDILCMDQSLFQ